MSTFHLLEDDLIKEYRRRGQFDTQRKLLLEEFQKSDYHEQFTKEIKNALENEMVLAKGQLPPYKSLMAAIEKKLFPQLMDFLSSREFLKSDTVASRIRAGMKETAMKMSEEKAAEKEQRDSAEQDKTGDKNDVSELPTIAPNSSEPARRCQQAPSIPIWRYLKMKQEELGNQQNWTTIKTFDTIADEPF
ncbi:hypothetical protein BC829DRAFT_104860 [Chytridium lagenaria]|nr:hypothetical protein BC829DRAFT_104860 [Chytridium lagenaria]